METTFIYFLRDPQIEKKGYVGKSDNPKLRAYHHLKETRKEKHRRARWIQSLLASKLMPKLEILDEVPKTEWPQWEVAYIQFFREEGYDLVNGNEGGEGCTNPSPETRQRMREAHVGRKINPWFGKRGAEHSCFGKPKQPPTPQAIANMSAAQKGRKHSPETKAKIRAANIGRKFSPEHCAKISATKRGLPWQ